MKNCPYCNSEIHDEAVFCVHCKSTLSSSAIEETNSAINRCPSCGNECDKNAILCVKCGSLLKNKANNKPLGKEKLIHIIAIVLCVLGTVINLLFSIRYFSIGGIDLIITAIGALVVLVGLIIGKKNKVPAIGYCIAALATIITIFQNIFYYFDETLIFILVPLMMSVVQSILVALLYLDNKALRKYWFIPFALCFITNFIIVIVNIIDHQYGYYYFSWSRFLVDVVTRIVSVIGVAVTCLNAKMNWCSEESKIN